MDSQTDFIDRLTYLGAALNGEPERIKADFQDIESFILDASLNLSFDTRVTQATLLWLTRYAA